MKKATATTQKGLSNHEIVTLAVYLLGGDTQYVDTEDAAVKANETAPGRFTWRKYRDQINIENFRTFLSDAKKQKNGSYLRGTGKDGRLLSEGCNWPLSSGLMTVSNQARTVLGPEPTASSRPLFFLFSF